MFDPAAVTHVRAQLDVAPDHAVDPSHNGIGVPVCRAELLLPLERCREDVGDERPPLSSLLMIHTSAAGPAVSRPAPDILMVVRVDEPPALECKVNPLLAVLHTL